MSKNNQNYPQQSENSNIKSEIIKQEEILPQNNLKIDTQIKMEDNTNQSEIFSVSTSNPDSDTQESSTYSQKEFTPIKKAESTSSTTISIPENYQKNKNQVNIVKQEEQFQNFQINQIIPQNLQNFQTYENNNQIHNQQPLLESQNLITQFYQNQNQQQFPIYQQQQQQQQKNSNITILNNNQSFQQQLNHLQKQFLKQQQKIQEITCPYCQKKYCHKSYLKKHIQQKHFSENSQYQVCNYCNKNYNYLTKAQYILHIESCRNNYKCIYCEKSQLRLYELNDHIRKFHSQNVQTQDGNTFYKCEICYKCNFRTIGILQQHIKKEHQDVNLKCEYCNESNFCKTTLLRHHQQEHLHDQKCNICGMEKLSLSELELHYQQVHYQGIVQNADQYKDDQLQNLKQSGKEKYFNLLSKRNIGIVNQLLQTNTGATNNNSNEKKIQLKNSNNKIIRKNLNKKQQQLQVQIEQLNSTKDAQAIKRSSYTNKIKKILSM